MVQWVNRRGPLFHGTEQIETLFHGTDGIEILSTRAK